MSGALFTLDPCFPNPRGESGHQPRLPRTNLLLAATIATSLGNAAVRMRNLSEGGAMLEGEVLPAAGDRLILMRSNLSAGAMCVWHYADRCGVKFDRPVSVPQWSAVRGATSAGQQRIDNLQATIRSGETIAVVSAPDKPAKPAIAHNIAGELGRTAQALRAIADRLSDDMNVIGAHGDILQNLDPLSQTLDHLARILAAPDPAPVIDTIGMDDLRLRLLQPTFDTA